MTKQMRLKILFIVEVLFAMWLSLASGAELQYEFETLDITIPGGPGLLVSPMDIDDMGQILTLVNRENISYAVATPPSMRNKFMEKTWTFVSCTGIPYASTMGISITNGTIVGGCVDAPIAPMKQFGFVKPASGPLQLIDFPGADGTMVNGRSTDGKLVGQFYGPLDQRTRGALAYRFHCWTLIEGIYKQIDYPAPNAYVSCDSINNRGQILMGFTIVTDQNETVESGAVIYDNGSIIPLGKSFQHVGGPWVEFVDMNEEGAVLGWRSSGVFLWDDGLFFDIKFPVGWRITQLGGMNNREQFVGTYAVQTGFDPMRGPTYTQHGFVASPAPVKRMKQGPKDEPEVRGEKVRIGGYDVYR